ncbi:class I mannose-6-phosphate isomerase [Aurantiacibacter hainanensis]|uniref:class I mannose-6-phosphate isomerase n=1 Tax=Aurantiacibacter hainanensis TaxID=3076114 RepID=UPI0030C77C07
MRLKPVLVDKVWGLDSLPPPFASVPGKRIGEIWFDPQDALPDLLVKYIFTSEKLSVQCHPDDAQANAAGHGTNGKDECWLVIDADEGAQLGIGFKKDIDKDTMRRAALDGTIEELLAWHEVAPGDFFYLPANTVHAIGAGLSIVEIQQNSNVTYRLYDYGRPRELHLDEGLRVASGKRFDPALRRRVPTEVSMTLVEGPHFRLDQLAGSPHEDLHPAYRDAVLVIPRAGTVEVSGEDVVPGECAMAGALDEVGIPDGAVCLVAAPHRIEDEM